MLNRLPNWIKTKDNINNSHKTHNIKKILRLFNIKTVCEEARCPNIRKCFSKPSIAFMILGRNCTRRCSFCSVNHSEPEPVDNSEPFKILEVIKNVGLKYIVITSVTRDDLIDGGAEQFAKTITILKTFHNDIKIEVLTPDFKGIKENIDKVITARPDVFNHNVETVPSLYPTIRPQADYLRSLNLLAYVKKKAPDIFTKSGIMLGLGENTDEVIEVMRDLRNCNCDILTIGQYLRPTKNNIPVKEYKSLEYFERLKKIALNLGFKYVDSGPLVRSSMNAENFFIKSIDRTDSQ
jgi:lipoic acid synthetase